MNKGLFSAGALCSGLICVWLAWLPLGALFGKIPNPPASEILDISLRFSLPPLVVGLICHAGSIWAFRQRRKLLAAELLVIAPMATFAVVYLVFLR
jgi:hypothetical protein